MTEPPSRLIPPPTHEAMCRESTRGWDGRPDGPDLDDRGLERCDDCAGEKPIGGACPECVFVTTETAAAIVDGLLGPAPWGPLTHVNPADPDTWSFRRTEVGQGLTVVTSFHPLRFAPTWGLRGTPHHFETLVISQQAGIGGFEMTYATEAEACDGHEVAVGRVRTLLEALALTAKGGAA